MNPVDMVYDVCRAYISDQSECVQPELIAKIDGYRRSRNLPQLTSCSSSFDPASHSIVEFTFLRQVEAFFKKSPIFSDEESCASAAIRSFHECEQLCNKTNLFLDFFFIERGRLDPDFNKKILKMERYIRNVLGEFTDFLEQLPSLLKVTSGATATSSRRKSLPQLKMKQTLCCTEGAKSYLNALYLYFGFEKPKLIAVKTNRVESVPKNWKTHRTIACEPEGNLPLQLAFDTYIKRRFRKFGINLSDQSANQNLASSSSVTDLFVTVDAKNASNTVAFNTVAWLLPYNWFKFLCDVRSPSYRGAAGSGDYAMFSSMGNGCTFTLETLIFAAACYASGSKEFLVYGDDVIIEKEFYPSFLELFRFFGFMINEDKTYSDGPFRESCGMDSFLGIDVTPFYIRDFDGRKATLCHLVNGLARISSPGGKLATYLRNLILEYKLPLVPFQENSLSGVWIHPSSAKKLKILSTFRYFDKEKKTSSVTWLWRYKAYLPCTIQRHFHFIRGYYLWFLSRYSNVSYARPWDNTLHLSNESLKTSSVPIYQHRYVRKWVAWVEPRGAILPHLYWWSDFIIAKAITK